MHSLFPFCTGDKPTLRQLQLLDCPSGVELRVIKTVAPKLVRLAIALNFDYSVIETVQHDQSEAELACISILNQWMRGEGQQPATWNTLIKALRDADYCNLAEDLRRELGSPSQQADQ